MNGQFFNVQDANVATRPFQKTIPIYAASGAPLGQEIIARECDLWFASYEPGMRITSETSIACAPI